MASSSSSSSSSSFTAPPADSNCAVCWQEFGINGVLCHVLDCGHAFCPSCINGFLRQRTCPSCRKFFSSTATLDSFPRCLMIEQMSATLSAQKKEINRLKPLADLSEGIEPSLIPAMKSISAVIKENRDIKAELTELKKNVEFLLDCRGGQLDAMVWMTEQYQKHMVEVRAKEEEERKKKRGRRSSSIVETKERRRGRRSKEESPKAATRMLVLDQRKMQQRKKLCESASSLT